MSLHASQVETVFGRFSFRELSSGLVAPQPAWLARNIVSVRVPFPLPTRTGRAETVRCHRLIAQQILSALGELNQRGLCRLIHSFDGCYVPRHARWDTKRPLSRHAWGIALDLNVAQFPFGSRRRQDPRLVEVLARHGFFCGQKGGGLWRNTLDPMHFEFADLSLLDTSSADNLENNEPDIRIEIDGLSGCLLGMLKEGRVYAPVREIAGALGASVQWHPQTRIVRVKKP